jgi:hypothetical protein
MDIPPSKLEDPRYAAFAWERYRALMGWMAGASTIAVIVGLGALRWVAGPIPWPMMIAASLGIFFSVLLAAALMGLVFLSSGTGHDESIRDPFADEDRAA